jgi:hypothetical protein
MGLGGYPELVDALIAALKSAPSCLVHLDLSVWPYTMYLLLVPLSVFVRILTFLVQLVSLIALMRMPLKRLPLLFRPTETVLPRD